MEIINLKENIYREGEYLIGAEQTKSHACYLIYGVLRAGEERDYSVGEGHAEIFCLIEGELKVNDGNNEYVLKKGQAFYLEGEKKVTASNKGRNLAIFVMAGGHISGDSHHH